MPNTLAWYDRLLPYAPYATALVASCALATAITAIWKQTQVARRRAAIDFFLKTDLDEKMLDAHRDFEAAVKKLKAHLAAGETVKAFEDTNTEEYRKILRYLNIHELIAVGIKNRVFDGDVCYNFWSDELVRHANDAKAVMDHEIESEGVPSAAFLQLRELSVEWTKRAQRWRDKQANAKRSARSEKART
jgi:hypothetical protein